MFCDIDEIPNYSSLLFSFDICFNWKVNPILSGFLGFRLEVVGGGGKITPPVTIMLVTIMLET